MDFREFAAQGGWHRVARPAALREADVLHGCRESGLRGSALPGTPRGVGSSSQIVEM